jgi:GxxExxY protein
MEEQKINIETILFKDESYSIQGAIFEVYRTIGPGFLESVYQECLRMEFKFRNISFLSQPDVQIVYKGEILPLTFKPDFVCYDKIIIELKAVNTLIDEHRAQVHNYLKASQMKLGVLVNFCHSPRVQIERILL